MKNESSKHVGIRIPKRIFDLIEEHYPNTGWSQIVREALAEKLKRDKNISIPSSDLIMPRGARNDMKTPKGREKALKQLEDARSRKGTRKEEAQLIKRAKKEVAKLALAFGKAKTRAEARSLADATVKPPHK